MQRITALLIGAFVTSCSGQKSAQQNAQTYFVESNLFVSERQDGSMVPLRPGEVFEVRLGGHGPTDPPSRWTVAAVPPHLRHVGENVVTGSSGGAGAGETRMFRFVAVAEGRGRLVFDAGDSGRKVSFEVEAANDMVVD